MSATLVQETGFSRDAVVALSEMKNEPTWLRDARLRAWDTYESLPMPARCPRSAATRRSWSTPATLMPSVKPWQRQ